jgi:hypothetical protein
MTSAIPITLANSILLPLQLTLDMLQTAFESGNQEALALAIHLCGQRELSLPAWVAKAWKQGCYDIVDRKVESWDHVLANGRRKTVKKLLRDRIKDQKKVLILWRADAYRDIPISNNKAKTILVGRRYVPDRFGAIARDLTSDGKHGGAWKKTCTRSEAKQLWYELFPPPTKTKHKK